jgi:hypothetical protein
MVRYPGFSERIFEFAFNAEFAIKNWAVLAACPDLPSLQDEKDLGYDVEFQISNRAGGIQSIFLQHKVARLVSSKAGSNTHFYNATGGPYYAFHLDVLQYNLIQGLAKHRKRRIYYCAPRCSSRRVIDQNFMQGKICTNAVWMDVKDSGVINDTKSHSIIYSQDGKHAFRFSSEPNPVATFPPARFADTHDRYERGLDRAEAKKLYDDVYGELIERWGTLARAPADLPAHISPEGRQRSQEAFLLGNPPRRIQDDDSKRWDFIAATSELLAKWYGVSRLIVCKHQPKEME